MCPSVLQIITHRGQRCALSKGVRGVRVAHPVRCGALQLAGQRWVISLDDVDGQHTVAAEHVPQTRRGDGRDAVQIGEQRRFRLPVRGRSPASRVARGIYPVLG